MVVPKLLEEQEQLGAMLAYSPFDPVLEAKVP
jgi:hypothetical protein